MTNQVPPGGRLSPDYVFKRPPDMPERTVIPLDKIVKGRWQPRRLFDQEKLEELANSIKEHGLLTPIKIFFNEDGFYELIAGERRTRACRLIGSKMLIPADVMEWSVRQIQEVSIIDNLQRENLSPEEEGHAFTLAVNTLGISEAELSRRMGKGRTYIQQRRQIAGAPEVVRAALASGEISFSIARGLLTGSGGEEEIIGDALEEILDLHKKGSMTEKDAKMIARSHLCTFYEEKLSFLGWKMIRRKYDPCDDGYIYDQEHKPEMWPSSKIIKTAREDRFGVEPREIKVAGWVQAMLKWRHYWRIPQKNSPWYWVRGQDKCFGWVHGSELAELTDRVTADVKKLELERRGYRTEFQFKETDAPFSTVSHLYIYTQDLQDLQDLRIGLNPAQSWTQLLTIIEKLPWKAPKTEPCYLCGNTDVYYCLSRGKTICKPCETSQFFGGSEPEPEPESEQQEKIICRSCGGAAAAAILAYGADGYGHYCQPCAQRHKKAQRENKAKIKVALALSAEKTVAKAQYDYTIKKILALLAGVDTSETLDEIAKAITKSISQRYSYDALADILYTEIETLEN